MKITASKRFLVLAAALMTAVAVQQGAGQMMQGGMMNRSASSDSTPGTRGTGQGTMRGHMMAEMAGNRMQGNRMAGAMGEWNLSDVIHGFGCPDCFLESADALGLTKEQIQKLENLGLDCKKVAIRKRSDTEVLMLDVKHMLGVDPVDWKGVQAKISEYCQLNESMLKAQLECLRSARGILTKEQLEKVKILNPMGMHPQRTGEMMLERGKESK